MQTLNNIFLILTALSIFFYNTQCCFAIAQSSQAKPDLETEIYQRAEIELNKNFYQLYRIIERIARANKLDSSSWRVQMPVIDDINPDSSAFNAYTKDGNLIIIMPGIIDSFSGDISILAFVAANQMAHQILKHNVKVLKNKNELNTKLEEYKSNLENNDESDEQNKLILWHLYRYWAPRFVEYSKEDNKEKINEEREKLYQDFLAQHKKREYDADELAIVYVTKAGFNPKSSLRFFDFLKRIPESSSSYSTCINRKFLIESKLNSINIQTLKNEGLKNIKNSKPLIYEKSSNGKTLIIHSKFSLEETPNAPFESLFGK